MVPQESEMGVTSTQEDGSGYQSTIQVLPVTETAVELFHLHEAFPDPQWLLGL